MAQNSFAKQNPTLQVKEITDLYMRKNFQSLQDYFQAQNQLLDFKFFEVVFTKAENNRKVTHGLSTVPQDILVSKITGVGNVTFNTGLFNKANLDISSSGACRVRFFAGTYFNYVGSSDAQATETQTFYPTVPASTWKAPTIQRLTGGSGTYNTPVGVKYLRIRMIGGGGGGGGTGAGTVIGAAGGPTSFGLSFLLSGGGLPAVNGGNGPAGGTNTVSVPATGPSAIVVTNLSGADGNAPSWEGTLLTSVNIGGAPGASSPFGGAGKSGIGNSGAGYPGGTAVANTGSGGGGGGTGGATSVYGGSGGAAGGYLEVLIVAPAASYPYVIGAGGIGGTAGTSGNVGGPGGSGVIIVEEYYQ